MKKQKLSFISILLVSIMLISALAACGSKSTPQSVPTDTNKAEDPTENGTEGDSEKVTDGNSGETSEKETDSSENVTEEVTSPSLIKGEDDGALIELADRLSNTVQTYYADAMRTKFAIENKNVLLTYNRAEQGNKLVSSLTDKSGNAYIENTMDVFVKMKDGAKYFASNSIVEPKTNIFRLGYYYYENRIEGQVFSAGEFENMTELEHRKWKNLRGVENLGINKAENSVKFKITNSTDPNIQLEKVGSDTKPLKADDYGYLEITVKANVGIISQLDVYIVAGEYETFSIDQHTSASISADGKFHTYIIPLNSLKGFTGNIKSIRFDVNGKEESTFEIKGIRLLGSSTMSPDNLSVARSFLTYSDKMHQLVQIAAGKETRDIESVGILTEIPADKVAKIVIKDIKGLHYSLEEKIAWKYVQYVGFDIKDAGIFGYIMPYDGKGGMIEVTLDSDRNVYVIEQTVIPDEFKIIPSQEGKSNGNDIFFGSRVYTDTYHSFDKFIYEAECEVNPLTSENVVINPLKSGNATFEGYDSLRGCYTFTIDPAWGFNGPFFEYPNRHFGVEFTVKGDDKNRVCYVMGATTSGSLECAALLDEKKMMLPMPIQVGKNFKGDGEANLYNLDDATYGESIIPFIINANSEDTFTMLHLYQNWGKLPLKQISSIQFFSPYYHLSVGTTETNCVVPMGATGLSLPDFRSCSAPYWKNQPQHNSCGTHRFACYTDANDVVVYTQQTSAKIDSFGPSYAEMTEYFISDCGSFTFAYNHMELPQTDENRTFYQIKIDFNKDINFKNFKQDFVIYNVKPNDPTGVYQRVGYLDENNESKVAAAKSGSERAEYKLGNNCPYFSFYDMKNYTSDTAEGYSNVAMLIYNGSVTLGGEEKNAEFVVLDNAGNLTLTLDLIRAEFKAGDSIVLNGILLPWGSQEMENKYDGMGNLLDDTANGVYFYDSVINEKGDKYEDKNVRDVREDSLLNPMTLTAMDNCEKVTVGADIFLPRAKTTNGKSASFSVKGGANNIAVRVYGFEKLTVPTIEKLVNGEWVKYDVTSASKPDQQGFGYAYDGYTVFYDGDGTYSYAFSFPIEKGEEATFRITADTDFAGYPPEEDPLKDLPLNVYISSTNINSIGASLGAPFGTSKYENNVKEGYFRFYGNGINEEAYVIPYKESSLYPTTGQYAVLKYRIPTTNTVKISKFDIFASTSKTGATGTGDCYNAYGSAIADGEWHVVVVDLSGLAEYQPAEDGTYRAKYMRFDVLNGSAGKPIPVTDYIDIAYFGISDSLDDICKLNSDMAEITLAQDKIIKTVDPKTGEITVPETPEENGGELKVMSDPYYIASSITGGCSSAKSDDSKYVRFTGKNAGEGYVLVYKESASKPVTGQYAIFKYRIPTDSVGSISNFEIFASTSAADPVGGSSIQFGGIKNDGEWHVMVVDLSGIATFKAKDGAFHARHARLDIINQKNDDKFFIDLEYFAMHDSVDEIKAYLKDEKSVTYVNADGSIAEDAPEDTPSADIEKEENGLVVYVDPSELTSCTGSGFNKTEGDGFVTYTGKGDNEGYVMLYSGDGSKITGNYFAIKYRAEGGLNNFEIFSSTKHASPSSESQKQFGSVKSDGQWHVIIVDLQVCGGFTADAYGQFSAKHIRLDILNGNYGANTKIDIAYVAIHNSLTELLAFNKEELESVNYVNKYGEISSLKTDGSVAEPDPFEKKEAVAPAAGAETTLPENTSGVLHFATPDILANNEGRSGVTVAESAGGSYVRYSGNGKSSEGFASMYRDANKSKNVGQYMIVKYRYDANNALKTEYWDIYAATDGRTQAQGDGDHMRITGIKQDGEWHVMVIDLSKISKYAAVDGKYNASLVRLDMFNSGKGTFNIDSVMDISFAAFSDELSELYALCTDMDSVTLYNGKTSTVINPTTGEAVQ